MPLQGRAAYYTELRPPLHHTPLEENVSGRLTTVRTEEGDPEELSVCFFQRLRHDVTQLVCLDGEELIRSEATPIVNDDDGSLDALSPECVTQSLARQPFQDVRRCSVIGHLADDNVFVPVAQPNFHFHTFPRHAFLDIAFFLSA